MSREAIAKKMRAVLPAHLVELDQPQIDLVDEGCRLQGMPAILTPHVIARDAAQLGVHCRHQLRQRVGVT